MKDRRTAPRLPVRDRAEVTCRLAPGVPTLEQHTIHCITRDVSFGGLNIRTYTHLPQGTTLDITFRSSDSDATFHHAGRVAWSHDLQEDIIVSHCVGVEFTGAARQDKQQWRRMISEKSHEVGTITG